MKLANAAYRLSNDLPRKEAYGLISQLQRAAVSVPSNIAEGHGRVTDLQFRHFLGNARGSLCELQTQVELAYDLDYISAEKFKEFMDKSSEVARLINGLITSLRELHAPAKKILTPLTAQSAANSASSALKDSY
ncbi:MAG TPA: four helix bundle protein [Terracidiphilus sp.]|jgi:four helix bundle protein